MRFYSYFPLKISFPVSLKWIFLGEIRLKLVKNHEFLILNRQRKSLEARSFIDEERITTLEKQLAEAQIIAEDADRRYDEVIQHLKAKTNF